MSDLTPATATIYHNPRCGTSRTALAALQDAGLTVEIVEYLKVGWTRPGLEALLEQMGVTARVVLRTKEPLVAERALDDASDDGILDAMVEHPALVERPIVVTAKGAKLCRPADLVQTLL